MLHRVDKSRCSREIDELMLLKINGTARDFEDGITIAGLLNILDIEPLRVAVELNMVIVKKCDYPSCVLKDNDAVEIVNFVGGG